MSHCSIDTALQELQHGKMVILVDDEKRENEGDLIIAAEKITGEAINFLAKYARGLICLSLSTKIIDKLNLSPQVVKNNSNFNTNFTVSIEARHGISTGISAFDRATTILTAISDHAKPEDLVSPGHIFPLGAKKYGVLERAGHTEGSVDLAKLAGFKEAAVLCEIMNEDGTMARKKDLEIFAKQHNLKICSIKDLIKYRLRYDKTIIRRIAKAKLPTAFGEFTVIAYTTAYNNSTHLALVKNISHSNKPTLTRIHSECMTGDVFASHRCDCGEQLKNAMRMIAKNGSGIIIYLRQEGRGIGLGNKICAYSLQDAGLDTVEANHKLGFATDLRDYGIAAQILLDLDIKKVRLMTNNPEKISALDGEDLTVIERIPLQIPAKKENFYYLKTKQEKMGHLCEKLK